MTHDFAAHNRGPIVKAVELLLAAGRAEGCLRADVEARDVVVLVSFLSRLNDTELGEHGQGLLSILVNGLRTYPS